VKPVQTMLEVRDLVKRYATRRGPTGAAAVRDVTFEVEAGRLFTLVGPSGCGKTTTLRCIAGLELPDAGHIAVGGRVLYSSERRIHVPANRRGLGMVFQSYAIWPHMTVLENVVYPLTVGPGATRPGKKDGRERAERALAAVELDSLAGRAATDLSGGQQQRLALARALVAQPPLLLLDEPLSNLDAKLRGRMRMELKRLQGELGVTTVFVTHDQAEALAISDRIAVMRDGSVEQIGTPRAIYERPATRFVADFVGAANLFDGRLSSTTGEVEVPALGRALRTTHAGDLAAGAAVTVVIRPEAMTVVEPGSATLAGSVIAQGYLGDHVELLVRVGEASVRVRTGPFTKAEPGTEIGLEVEPTVCRILSA
jgi:iron(III) transport system ATP-binding protein